MLGFGFIAEDVASQAYISLLEHPEWKQSGIIVIVLRFKWDFTLDEIGECFGKNQVMATYYLNKAMKNIKERE